MDARDYNGNKLNVGDVVIFIRPNYREFITGVISGFTPKYVCVKYRDRYKGYVDIHQIGSQLIKR